jgi:hypothetical protein
MILAARLSPRLGDVTLCRQSPYYLSDATGKYGIVGRNLKSLRNCRGLASNLLSIGNGEVDSSILSGDTGSRNRIKRLMTI